MNGLDLPLVIVLDVSHNHRRLDLLALIIGVSSARRARVLTDDFSDCAGDSVDDGVQLDFPATMAADDFVGKRRELVRDSEGFG